jgi:hypothetical protein
MWAHSGRELFYMDDSAFIVSVTIETEPTFRVLSQEPLFGLSQGLFNTNTGFYDVSPDDQRFLMGRRAIDAVAEGEDPELILVQNWFEELKARARR